MRSSLVSQNAVMGIGGIGLMSMKCSPLRSRSALTWAKIRTPLCRTKTAFQGIGRSVTESKSQRRHTTVCRANVDPIDRALGSIPYLLPLLDGLQYGTYIFSAFPFFVRLLGPVFPLYNAYNSLPFSSIIVFFALYFGVARNQRLTRFVRFNAMQAILIDILLILPGFLQQLFRISYEFRVPLYNVTWMYVFCCTAIGIGSCFAGRSVRLPLVADASDAQIG